jgi:cytochrome c553
LDGLLKWEDYVNEKPYVTGDQQAKVLAEKVCSVCHGVNGISKWKYIPNLAAMDKTYLVEELKGMKSRSRATHYSRAAMWGVAANLSDVEIDALAEYFSSMPAPTGDAPGGVDPALGRDVFLNGIKERGVAPCSICHVNGQGDLNVPRLAGQHAEYVARMLRDFRSSFRVNVQMSFIAGKLKDDEIDSLAAYVSTLNAPAPKEKPEAW